MELTHLDIFGLALWFAVFLAFPTLIVLITTQIWGD